ncbi:disks large homolog 5-like [Periophthalmus magnuspinnatus]|uniref:disks large homolog 5-like n=1 Tax=Periophthalmus magnuspinnatus TaxID=409849 RepID=UPI002436547C|nr:disks large homolog 5-like [Periophthalmus magnuspinnatus]
MEPKHRALLEKCSPDLVEQVTDPDRLVDALVRSGAMSQSEGFELGHSCSSNSEKVELLLKILQRKDTDCFMEFCAALETVHPRVHALLLDRTGPDHSTGSSCSVLSMMPSDSESSSSLSSLGTPAPASSPPPTLLEGPLVVSEKIETVLFQLRQVTRERDELRKRLALSSPGTTFDDCRPNSKQGHDYERLKLQCLKAMADLQSLQNQHSSTLKRCEEAVKKADFYHTLHSRVVSEHAQMKEELELVRQDNMQLVQELRMLHQQVMREGSSEVLTKLYDSAVDKFEALKSDYETLRKRYNDNMANHNADLSRLDQAEEENHQLQKQLELLLKQRDAAFHYQQQYCSARRFDSAHLELSKATAQNKELQREMERLQTETTRLKTQQLKALSECEKYKDERDSVMCEYRLIMSERDQVIKEVDRLQTGLDTAQAKLKNSCSERRVASEEMEALRQELASALVDRDRAICEKNELLEKYCDEVKNKAETQKELNQAFKDLETLKDERDVARKERTEAIIQRDRLLREYYQARQKQDSATLDLERVNKDLEVSRKQFDAISQELRDALQEADVAKCRRDWAFDERDKIVAERESIRTLCDNLRRERDRAVSELADALRNLDDTRKQKNDAARELKEIKEKMENQFEKEARFHQLIAHSSHDSAIDTDSIEWETEVVELEKQRDMDLKALGFDVSEGVSDPYLPGDCGVFVSKVDKGSVAEGRLRVNDWLLKVNDVDLTNKDRKQVIKAVLSGEGILNMVVRRRKSLGGRVVTPVQISLTGSKESGIGLESGVFVAALAPGSPAAREGALNVGDRLLAINGIALDNKSLSECESLLRSCGDAVSVSLLKIFPQSCSGQSLLFESSRDSVPRLQSCDLRNIKHNNSATCPKSNCPHHHENGDSEHESNHSNHSYSNRLHSRSLSHNASPRCPSENHPDYCYRRRDLAHPPIMSFNQMSTDFAPPPVNIDRNTAPPSGGTWPKVMVGASIPECTSFNLSIFKKPKQRKSIFDLGAFKRPDTAPKLDYVSLSHAPKLSPQSSISENPPTPPTRSDSFRFKHRQQNSSASDSTITTGTPPMSPTGIAPGLHDGEREGEGQQLYSDTGAGEGAERAGEEEGGRKRAETQRERNRERRYRPKSAPTSRNVTPLHISMPMQVQSFSNDEHSPEPVDLLRFSPVRSNRYSLPFSPPNYSTISGHAAQRGPSPCSAITAVMRNPVYTAWSHEVQNNSTVQSLTSPQHQGRVSLDLNLKRSEDVGEISAASHNSNCLPSSNRTGAASLGQFKRIKIPLVRHPRSSGSDRGSLSHSECSSPTPPTSPVNLDTSSFSSSQSQSSISPQPRVSVSPASLSDRRKDGPYLGEPRNVTVQKGAEPLGISIVSGENGGVFVSKVTAGSIAHQAHLEFGDQLLEFNGINLRNATEQQARIVIGQQCDTVTILAQYNPHMFQLGNHSRSGSRLESISNQPTPLDSGGTTPDHLSSAEALSEQEEGTMTPPSKQTTPATSPSGSFRLGSGPHRQAEVRVVRLKRVQGDLGVQLCGGNITGAFVESLDEDSAAKCPDGLLPGDLMLECNGVSLKNKTKEEVYLEMLKSAENVTFKVQNCVNELQAVRDRSEDGSGDGFYIRALYERVAEVEQELSFKKDDILYVDDTLPNGNLGYWSAWQLDEKAHRLQRGQIPSQYIMDQELYRRHAPDSKDDSSKSLSAAARRSFFRRRQKHKRSNSKDAKDNVGLDAISTESFPITEDGVCLVYQHVLKVEPLSPRPVLIFGPLVDPCKDHLIKESTKFCRCPHEVMKASQQAIERGVQDGVFIDFRRRSGHFDVTTVATIKEVTEKDCHCLLDIAPYAIERLHAAHIYPIVIFIRYKNAKQIKEQKDPVYLRDKLSQKHSKEQFDAAQKVEQEFGRFFTGVVQGGGVSFVCSQILSLVEQEQSKVLWIPDGPP